MKKIYKGNNFTAIFTDEDGYFSLTDSVSGTGAVGDKLAKIDPKFKMLNNMHLCNSETGEPMYAIENGYFLWKQDGFNPMTLQNYWMGVLTLEQLDKLHEAPEKITKAIAVCLTKQQMLKRIYKEVQPRWKEMAFRVRKIVESIPSNLTEIDKSIDIEDFAEPGKALALAQHLDCHFSLVAHEYDHEYLVAGKTYAVVTDDEADELWDQDLDSYLEDCIYPELPDNARMYFDNKKWKEDARVNGRGHSLARYDGEEREETVELDGGYEETYYIYRN